MKKIVIANDLVLSTWKHFIKCPFKKNTPYYTYNCGNTNLKFHNYNYYKYPRTASEEEEMTVEVGRSKRKETPPPPYEDPPSYSVAVQMEHEWVTPSTNSC